jgi:hypothetical protein
MTTDAVFREASAERRVESVAFAHLSIELGHLYMEDYQAGPQALRRHFGEVVPWVEAAGRSCADRLDGRRPRISTCFLVDDYFSRFGSPRTVLPDLLSAAQDCGLRIDYLGRESACARADEVRLAELVRGRLVAEPPPDTTGARPPVTESGWLCNGQRSPASGTGEAMGGFGTWAPPAENAANRHSIFIDVQLWDDGGTWSCPYLAAIWQLLRLGALRDGGRAVARPRPWTGDFPASWDELPPVLQLNPGAAAFTAYRTFTVLAGRFLPIEHGVRTILGQVAVDDEVARQAAVRAADEGVPLPDELVDRIGYAFIPTHP